MKAAILFLVLPAIRSSAQNTVRSSATRVVFVCAMPLSVPERLALPALQVPIHRLHQLPHGLAAVVAGDRRVQVLSLALDPILVRTAGRQEHAMIRQPNAASTQWAIWLGMIGILDLP